MAENTPMGCTKMQIWEILHEKSFHSIAPAFSWKIPEDLLANILFLDKNPFF
jgi:hypothetical protein